MKRIATLILAAVSVSFTVHAQLLTWTPNFAKDNDNIVITVDATKGNQGLNNYANTTDVYVHTGVITSSSTNSSNLSAWRARRPRNRPSAARDIRRV